MGAVISQTKRWSKASPLCHCEKADGGAGGVTPPAPKISAKIRHSSRYIFSPERSILAAQNLLKEECLLDDVLRVERVLQLTGGGVQEGARGPPGGPGGLLPGQMVRHPLSQVQEAGASIGYSTCHWCHVMGRESFQDPAVAEVLNRAAGPGDPWEAGRSRPRRASGPAS